MADKERYDLEFVLNRHIPASKYRNLLADNEIVRNDTVLFKARIFNRSGRLFPGTKITHSINEHGFSSGIVMGWGYPEPITIPSLKDGEEYESEIFTFEPYVEGICEVEFSHEDSHDFEVWLKGLNQSTPVKNKFSQSYVVVNRHNLEIIILLKRLLKTKGA